MLSMLAPGDEAMRDAPLFEIGEIVHAAELSTFSIVRGRIVEAIAMPLPVGVGYIVRLDGGDIVFDWRLAELERFRRSLAEAREIAVRGLKLRMTAERRLLNERIDRLIRLQGLLKRLETAAFFH